MTVPVQVLAAVRSIPHPRQEPTVSAPRTANAWNWGGVDMTPAPDLSPAEAARVAEFDAAPEPPESSAVVVAMLALADELDREGQMVVHNGTMNRHSYITRRIRAAITAALDPS